MNENLMNAPYYYECSWSEVRDGESFSLCYADGSHVSAIGPKSKEPIDYTCTWRGCTSSIVSYMDSMCPSHERHMAAILA